MAKVKKVLISKEIRTCGGDNRTRICDLLRVKQALYRLSYASIVVTRTGLEPVLPP